MSTEEKPQRAAASASEESAPERANLLSDAVDEVQSKLGSIADTLDWLMTANYVEMRADHIELIRDENIDGETAPVRLLVFREDLEADKEAIEDVGYKLDDLVLLHSEVHKLIQTLRDIDAEHQQAVAQLPGHVGRVSYVGNCDLGASIAALIAVRDFLLSQNVRPYLEAQSLGRLITALTDLWQGGAPAAMLWPERRSKKDGRRPEGPSGQFLKGALAGLAHVQHLAGMSRRTAAKWVADHVFPDLAALVSKKRITPRTIEEWRDRYSSNAAPEDAEGARGYSEWSRPCLVDGEGKASPLTAEDMRHFSKNMAQLFPMR